MKTTRFRGGTPTAYEGECCITDPGLLAQLDHINRLSEQWLDKHIQDAVARAQSEYQYHPPPDMSDSDTEDDTLPYYNNLPSPASTPPPPRSTSIPPPQRATAIHPIQSQPAAVLPTASIASTLSETECHCTWSKGGTCPPSNLGSPQSTSLMNKVSTHKATCQRPLYPSATAHLLASQAKVEEDQISNHHINQPLSSQPAFLPVATDAPHSDSNNAVRRTRQSQPSSVATRSMSSASTCLAGPQRPPRKVGRAGRPTRTSSAKRATASTESGGKWDPLLLLI